MKNSNSKTQKIIARTIQILFVILGMIGGFGKIFGSEYEAQTFEAMGLSHNTMIIFGVLQLGGGLLLILPKTLLYGALILLGTFVVSTIALMTNSVFPTAFIPLVFIVLTVVLILLRKSLSQQQLPA